MDHHSLHYLIILQLHQKQIQVTNGGMFVVVFAFNYLTGPETLHSGRQPHALLSYHMTSSSRAITSTCISRLSTLTFTILFFIGLPLPYGTQVRSILIWANWIWTENKWACRAMRLKQFHICNCVAKQLRMSLYNRLFSAPKKWKTESSLTSSKAHIGSIINILRDILSRTRYNGIVGTLVRNVWLHLIPICLLQCNF